MRFEQILAISALNLASMVVSLPLAQPANSTTGTAGTCTELTANEKKGLLDKLQKESYDDLHWTFWLIPYLQQSKQEGLVTTEENESTPDRSTYLYGPKRCSRLKHFDKEYDCPAQYVMHHDVNRIPENIVYAKCVCERCRHANANHSKQCQPMYTLTRVLRRNSECVYDWAYDRVPVACTCKATSVKVNSMVVHAKDVPIVPKSQQTNLA